MLCASSLGVSDTSSGQTDESHTDRVRINIWHPNCWMLRVTNEIDAGLVVPGVYEVRDTIKGQIVAYGDDTSVIDDLVAAVRTSPLTDSVHEMELSFATAGGSIAPGNTTRELLVTYRSENSIHNSFVSRGLIPDEAIRIVDGREHWTVLVEGGPSLQERLDEIRHQMNAEISIDGIGVPASPMSKADRRLTERQREVFETARRSGYYEWPREISADALANDIGIAKTTLLEHLRKAETKLLNP